MSGARNRSSLLAAALIAGAALSGCFWNDREDAPVTLPGATATTAPLPSPTPGAAATATPSLTAPSAELAAANELLREGRFNEAKSAFQRVAESAADAAVRTEALLGAGKASAELEDTRTAFASFEKAVGEAPAGSNAAIRAAYLYSKHLNDAGRHEDAARFFREDPDRAEGSTIDSYFRSEGARAFAATGDVAAAMAVWEPLLASRSTSTALKTSAYQQQADAARRSGDELALVVALDGLIVVSGDPGARFERANIARDAGDMQTFQAQLTTLVARNPGSRYAVLALDALAESDMDVDPGDAGLAYYRRGLYERAISTLLPAVESAPTGDALAFRAFYLGASYEDLGRDSEAVRYYDVAVGSGSSGPYVHRAAYWAARVTEGMGHAAEASQRYVALANAAPGEFTAEAAFRAGYALHQAGDEAGALEAWAGMGAASARLEYWRGRALESMGRTQEARAAYARAVELGPLDLHGMEAALRLGNGGTLDVRYRDRDLQRRVDWAAIASWLSNRIGGSASGAGPTAACELMAAGLRDEAEAEIWAAGSDTPWRTFESMREASECGLTDVAAQLAVRLSTQLGVPSHERPADLLRVAYPVDYGATLAREAKKPNLDQVFFAALIRQESFWDPEALSPANAYGLTQVIPPTGEAIAAGLGVEDFEPEQLWRPALSLEFGANYIGGQVARYGNALIALSAYNAGPGNASRWANAEAATPADLVEVIDFVETRNYVTYIYEGYAHYRLAWAGE